MAERSSRTRRVPRGLVLCVIASAASGCGLARAHPADVPREARTVARAAALLPTPLDVPVVPIDSELAADPASIRELDAFIVRERDGQLRQVIYVNARAPIVERATRGSRLFLAVLAAVLHHEWRHLRGEDEASARRGEREMFQALMRRGVVGTREGERYLAALDRQPLPAHLVTPAVPP